MTTLVEKILAVEDALSSAQVEHAFGGALALAFHIAEPRGTRDIDVNVFVTPDRAEEVFAALPDPVRRDAAAVELVRADGQVRLFWDDNPLDLFFANHPFHDAALAGCERVPFEGRELPILGATELCVFKAFFDRTKDWADIEAMVAVGTVDGHRALGWLVDLLGGDAPRVERLRTLLRSPEPGPEPRLGA